MPDIFSRPSFAQSSGVAPAGMQQFGVPRPDTEAGAAQAGQIIPLPITPPATGGGVGIGGWNSGDGIGGIRDGEGGGGTMILGPQQGGMPPFPFTQKELMHIMRFRPGKGGY